MTTECKATSNVDLTKVKPYGDTLNDGMTELSFTLPVPVSYTHLFLAETAYA